MVTKQSPGMMHKTATGWNTQVDKDLKKIKQQANFGATQTGFILPPIELKTAKSWKDKFPLETADPYIKSITNRGEVFAATANNSIDCVSLEEQQAKIRTFNWEGIHFEISPRKPETGSREAELQAQYSKEMNLMKYNFNNSTASNRNRSESPRPDPDKDISSVKTIKPMSKKESVKVVFKEKHEIEANQTASTTANANDDERIEKRAAAINKGQEECPETDDGLKNSKEMNKSQRSTFGQANSAQVAGRIQSPPNPITNTSNIIG